MCSVIRFDGASIQFQINMDRYKDFEELRQYESNSAFTIRQREGASGVVVMAPHGGGIEPGTTELADAIADVEHTFYTFEGRKRRGNRDLHITSTNFDEPAGMAVAARSYYVLVLHGCVDKEEFTYLGGLDYYLKERVRTRLIEAGFKAAEAVRTGVAGNHPKNICNQGARLQGVQIEISAGLREKMFADLRSRAGRSIGTTVFDRFVGALRRGIYDVLNS